MTTRELCAIVAGIGGLVFIVLFVSRCVEKDSALQQALRLRAIERCQVVDERQERSP